MELSQEILVIKSEIFDIDNNVLKLRNLRNNKMLNLAEMLKQQDEENSKSK